MTNPRSSAGSADGDDGTRWALAPAARKPVPDLIGDHLLAMVRAEELAPGDRLPTEPELARLMGVARSSVRTALQRLEARGVVEVNRAATEISLRASSGRSRVFASIGPTGKLLTMGETTESELSDVFGEQARALADAGADALLLETVTDVAEIGVAIEAARATGVPVVASMVFDSGKNRDRTMMGATPEQAAIVLRGVPGAGSGAYGLTRFRFALDPAEEGAGYYIRGLQTSIVMDEYDDAMGTALFRLDGFADNSSQFIAYYAMRNHFTGQMAWVQGVAASEPEATHEAFDTGQSLIPLR